MRHHLVHLARWSLLAVIVLAVRERQARFDADERVRREVTASVDRVRTLLPIAAAFGPSNTEQGGRAVLDAAGEPAGFVVQTLPAAAGVVGYSGPNDVLLVFDADGRLAGAELLASGDTPDHVALVRNDADFLRGFRGKTWTELAATSKIDGVSGATLTSAAVAEAIVTRLAGTRPSFRFPEPLAVADAQAFFPEAESLSPDPAHPGAALVKDGSGKTLGRLVRTSPGSDATIGYQGPTDGLLAVDAAGKIVVGIGIRKSYDTPRYVEDVSADWTFLHRFDGLPLSEFAGLSVGVGKDVEGVSGATMTSQVLTENLVDAAKRMREETGDGRQETKKIGAAGWEWGPRVGFDLATAAVVLLALAIAFTDLRGKTWVRRGWQVVLIGYLGLVAGDLLSQSLLVGWAKNGLPWRLAPGLVLLAAAALAVPLTTKTQLYCHHLCPHGAAQELLRNRLPWRWHVPRRLDRLLGLIPAGLLAVVLAVALWRLPLDLADLEPFDAYSVRAAGVATVAIAVAGLVASLFVPMAYCRYGCPTGAVLGYLRRHGRSDRLTRRDALAAGLAAVAAIVAWA